MWSELGPRPSTCLTSVTQVYGGRDGVQASLIGYSTASTPTSLTSCKKFDRDLAPAATARRLIVQVMWTNSPGRLSTATEQ